MTCALVRKQMMVYLERLCPADDLAAMTHHLESCQACAQELADYRRVTTLLQQVRPIPPDPSLWPEMMTALREQRARTLAEPWSARRSWLGGRAAAFRRPLYAFSAAAAVVITGATIIWYLLTAQPTPMAQSPRDGDDMSFYLKEHALIADQSVFSNGAFGSVLVSSPPKK